MSHNVKEAEIGRVVDRPVITDDTIRMWEATLDEMLRSIRRWGKVGQSIEQLEWIDRQARDKETGTWVDDYRKSMLLDREVILKTERYHYHITTNVKENGRTYLGCIAKSVRDKNHHGYYGMSDLHDGDLSWVTWNYIMRDIVGYELVSADANKEG